MKEDVLEFLAKEFPGANVKISYEFPVLHRGWELDNDGFIAEIDGKHVLVFTSHNSPYVAEAEELERLLNNYQQVTTATSIALEMLK